MGPTQEKIDALEKRMAALGIRKADIEEKFVKSAGRGGQKVNKSNSAVFLKHLPTGLTVKYGKTRSQNLNRFLALRHLTDKIEAVRKGEDTAARKAAEKIRKQKKRRKKKARTKHQ